MAQEKPCLAANLPRQRWQGCSTSKGPNLDRSRAKWRRGRFVALNATDPPRPKMIRDYWPRHHKKTITLTLITQVIVTLLVACALVIGGGMTLDDAAFWVIIVAVL